MLHHAHPPSFTELGPQYEALTWILEPPEGALTVCFTCHLLPAGCCDGGAGGGRASGLKARLVYPPAQQPTPPQPATPTPGRTLTAPAPPPTQSGNAGMLLCAVSFRWFLFALQVEPAMIKPRMRSIYEQRPQIQGRNISAADFRSCVALRTEKENRGTTHRARVSCRKEIDLQLSVSEATDKTYPCSFLPGSCGFY